MSEPYIGEIQMYGFNFAPRGWALCDGQLLQISQHSALFSILSTTFGGNGRTDFALPGLRGRTPIHVGTGPGLSARSWGQKGGEETHTLNTPEIPTHDHDVMGTHTNATADHPGGAFPAITEGTTYTPVTPTVPLASQSVGAHAGSGTPHNNLMPYLTVNFCIALLGIYPSRN